jgi:arylsulfatase A-like enzyme
METDNAVGRMLATLEEAGVARNTLVFLSSDNGYETAIGIKPLEGMGHFPSGPLRGYKRDVWEGGHRVPFIVRFPGVVKPGSVSDALVHQADVFATVAELLGVPIPDNAGEDSVSLLPLLRGSATSVRQHAISCGVNGTQALRDGPWKLICLPKPQLYHLGDDLGERIDLAEKHPERVRDMLALRERFITEGRTTAGTPQRNDVPVRR